MDVPSPVSEARERWPLAFRAACAMACGAAIAWWMIDRAAEARESATLVDAGAWSAERWMLVVASVGFVCGAITAMVCRSRAARDASTLAALACAGAALAVHAAVQPGPFDGMDGGPVTVRGLVASAPTVDDGGGDRLARFAIRNAAQSFELDMSAVIVEGRDRAADGSILVRVAGLAPLPARGTPVSVRGWFHRAHSPRNPGMRRSHSDGTITVPGSSLVKPAQPGAVLGAAIRLRAAANDALMESMPAWASAESRALVAAMTTGVKLPGLSVPGASFRAAGMSHVLAISGFNVAVLVAACAGIAGLCGVRAKGRALVAVVVAIAFLAITEPETSVLRAGLGAGLAAVASLRGGRARGLGTLGAVAIVTMLMDIDAIAGAGFQLSYGVVVALLVVSPRVQGRWERRTDDWSSRFKFPAWICSEVAGLARAAMVESVAAALVAWTISTPIAAWHAGCLNGWAAPLSVVTMPAAALTTIMGVGAIVAQALLPCGGGWCGSISAACAALLDRTADLAAHAPGGTWWTGRPGAWWTAAALVACVVAWIAARRLVRVTAWCAVAILVDGLWLGAFRPCAFPPGVGEVTVESIAVGNGACRLVRTVDATVLFDAGTTADPNAGSRRIVPALAALGVRRIDLLVLGSRSLAEFSAVPEVATAFAVGGVVMDPRSSASIASAHSGASVELREFLAGRHIPILPAADGECIRVGSLQLRATVVAPDPHDKYGRPAMIVDARDSSWTDGHASLRVFGSKRVAGRAGAPGGQPSPVDIPVPTDAALRVTARADGTVRAQHWTGHGWR